MTTSDDIRDVDSSEFPPGMAPKILNLLQTVTDLENKLKPLTSKPYHEILPQLDHMGQAKIGMMEVYTMNSLFWALMKTSGQDIEASLKEDYKVEMKRVRETQERLAELEIRGSRPRLDLPATSRFIKRGLGKSTRAEMEGEDSTSEQRVKKSWKPKRYEDAARVPGHSDEAYENGHENGYADQEEYNPNYINHMIKQETDMDEGSEVPEMDEGNEVPEMDEGNEDVEELDGGSDEVPDTDEEECSSENPNYDIDVNRGPIDRMATKRNWYDENGWI